MQDSRAGSTLELVVNEQQLNNMSQIDLSRQSNQSLNQQQQQDGASAESSNRTFRFNLDEIKCWPARFRENFGAKMDEAKAKSETKTQYVIEILRAFSGLFIWLGCFFCTIIVPTILLFMGLFNLDQCAASPSLPYYVFTIGFVMTASNLFNLALALELPILTNHRVLTSDIKNIIASILNIVFNTVVAFFYILTASRVYAIGRNTSGSQASSGDDVTRETDPAANTEAPQVDCSESLYEFTFWFVTLTLSLFVIISLLALVLFLYNRYRLALIRGSTPRSHLQPTTITTANQPNLSPNVSPSNGI